MKMINKFLSWGIQHIKKARNDADKGNILYLLIQLYFIILLSSI